MQTISNDQTDGISLIYEQNDNNRQANVIQKKNKRQNNEIILMILEQPYIALSGIHHVWVCPTHSLPGTSLPLLR